MGLEEGGGNENEFSIPRDMEKMVSDLERAQKDANPLKKTEYDVVFVGPARPQGPALNTHTAASLRCPGHQRAGDGTPRALSLPCCVSPALST